MAKIASIYFYPVRAERPYGGPYILPPVSLGLDPILIEIGDRIQIEQGPVSLGQGGKRSRRRHLITGAAIAKDIVSHWTEHGVGMTPQCHPGIWVVREEIPLIRADGTPEVDAEGVSQWRPATEEEMAFMWMEDLQAARAADRTYAQLLYMQANAMADEPKMIPFISELAKSAAKQYGLEAEWLKDDAQLLVKTCPYCTKVIPSRAIKCPKCTEIVDIEAYAQLEANKQQALKEAKEAAARRSRENAA